MIKLKEPIKINGQVVIPYYIKDGEVMCFDKNGKQIFIDEKEFYKKPEIKQEIQTVIPLRVEEKKIITPETKKEEDIKKENKATILEVKKEENKIVEIKDNIIKDEDYI